MILYSKTGLKLVLKISGIQNKSDSDLVWQIHVISIKGYKFPIRTTRMFNL